MIDFNQKKRLRRSMLAILMVSAMLIATPIGTVQIYAEGGEPDTTPPAFAEGYPKEAPQMNGSRQIGIVINSPEKVYYYLVLLPDGAKVPTKEQVVAGKDGDNNIPLKSQNSGSNKYSSIQTGLFAPLHNTSYDVYVVIKDDAGNLSEPSLVNVISPPPADFFVTGFPKTGEIQPDGSKQVEVKVKLKGIDSDRKGKVYWVLLPDKSAAPSIEQIASGTDKSDSPAISTGSPEFSGNTEGSFIVTGTTGGTEYDLYMVVGHTHYAYPLSECTEVVKLDVTTPADIEGEKVCSIGSTEYGTLSEALAAVKTGETIKILKSFTDIQGIIINNKNITFDLNGNTLDITTTADEGLKATNASLTLVNEGKLNVSGKLYGVWATGANSNVTVTNATASDTGESGIGIFAVSGSDVTVREDVYGSGHGVRAENIYTNVTVNGNVSTKGQIKGAVHAAGQANVIVRGNVTNSMGYGVHSIDGSITVEKNVSGSHVGALSEGNEAEIIINGDLSSYNNGAVIISGKGSITVNGEIKTSANYIIINSKNLLKTDGVLDSEKFGYLKYTDISGSVTGKVWVKTALADMACQIGSIYYDSLEKALAEVKTGETIKLLKDISYEKSVDYDGAVSIKGKIITFDLDGHNLTVSNPTYSGINLSNSAELNVIGGGKLNVNSRFAALNIAYSKFTSDNTVEVMLESQLNSGISAESSSDVNISKGTIKGGIYAYSNNNINVSGPVTINRTGESHGIMLNGVGNTVNVRSVEVLSGSGSGIYMYEGGSVTVGTADNPGYVIGKGDGITTRQGSKRAYVTVYGNVEGGAHGIYATDDAEIKVFGNVDSISTNSGVYCIKSFAGITSSQSNLIEIHGNAVGVNGIYAGGAFGNIKINGNVNATGTDASENCGIYASYGSVDVSGNVYAPNCIGAKAGDNGQITIDGSLTGKKFVWVYYEFKTAEDKILPTTKEGYDTYSNNTAFIWIKNSAPPVATYALTVENGSGSGSYTAGTNVNISAAAAPNGQEFSHWTTDNGGIFQNSDSALTIFTMPGNAVTIKANYKAIVIPSVKYSINASAGIGGSISPYGSINVEENGSQTFVIIPNNNYTISSVLVDGVEKGAISEYTFSNVTTCHAISAAFAATTSSGIKTKTKNYSVASPVITIKPDKKPNQPLVAATVIGPVTDSKGDLIVTVTDNIITEIISKANSEAEKQKRTERGIGVCIETKTPPDMKALRFVLTQPVLKQLIDSKIQQFEIDCGMLSLSFNLEALNEIRRQSDSDVIIRINKNNELEKSDKEHIEVRSLFDIELTHIKNRETRSITDLNNGKLTLTIPYTLSRYDAVGYLFGIAIDGKSGVNRVFGSNYDVNSKSVIIDNDIISTYGVGYIQPSARFTDITDHWAKESIDYIVGRELFKGTSDTCFSPDMIISRGMIVTVLGRLEEADVSTFKNSSFDDVANDMYYMPYIEWAYNNGIIKGVDGNSFEPDRGMTREEVALVFLNYAKATGYSLPLLNSIIVFEDNDEISDFAKDAVAAVQQAGIIKGDQNNRFKPKNAVTRAEAAAILQRYISIKGQ